MNRKKKTEQRARTLISFHLSETGKTGSPKLEGSLDYILRKGVIVTTNYPLEQGHVLHFTEEIRGHRFGVVKRVLEYGQTFMAQIDFR